MKLPMTTPILTTPARTDWTLALGAPLLYVLLLLIGAQALGWLGLRSGLLVDAAAQRACYGSLALLLVQLVAGLGSFAWLRRRLRTARGAHGIGFTPSTRGWLLAGEVGGLALAVTTALIVWRLPHVAGGADLASLPVALPTLPLAGTLVSVLLAPVFEEGIFRGALLGALRPALGALGAGLGSTLLFTLLHLPEHFGTPWGLLPIAALGGFAAWLRVRSGSLWPGLVAHVCFNALLGLGALR